MTDKNALAELAEELDFNHFPHTCSKRQDAALLKAQRIIAELANVECQPPDYIVPYDGLAFTAYAKCRAIAEERTSNGK